MSEKHKCHLCGQVGQNGARYLLSLDGETHRVHKPCGDQLVVSAPAGVKIFLRPSEELKREWQEKRNAERVRQFWAVKCPQLIKIKEELETPDDSLIMTPVGPACQ